jgi:hypothetical protein
MVPGPIWPGNHVSFSEQGRNGDRGALQAFGTAATVPLADSAGLDKLTACGFIALRDALMGVFVGF